MITIIEMRYLDKRFSDVQDLVKRVHLADYICHMHNQGDSANPYPTYDHQVWEQFNLTTEKIGELMGVVEEEAANSEILLSLAE